MEDNVKTYNVEIVETYRVIVDAAEEDQALEIAEYRKSLDANSYKIGEDNYIHEIE